MDCERERERPRLNVTVSPPWGSPCQGGSTDRRAHGHVRRAGMPGRVQACASRAQFRAGDAFIIWRVSA
jgi:hypothetical protein